MNRRDFALASLAALASTLCLARRAMASEVRSIDSADALIVIDVQNCFLPGGTLAVANGDQIIPLINKIATKFTNVILTQDWHPGDHVSFDAQHSGKKAFDSVTLSYGTQTLWPAHCVQGTSDAELAPDLSIPQAQLIIRKGFHAEIDSYSAFLEADKKTDTGLAGYLKGRAIRNLYLCGLATDFCVAWTALDARTFGFNVTIIEDATRAIDKNGSLEAAWRALSQAGVQRIQASVLL